MKKIFLSLIMLTGIGAMAQVNPCDVNYDNKVNTADVVAIYNNIIDGTVPTKPEMKELSFEIIYQDLPLNLVMKPVEGGTFMMGATGEQAVADDDESPAHLVTLSSYYIEFTELPQSHWESIMGSNDIDDVAWYSGNSNGETHSAGIPLKKANELGLYDMSGNVWEWCQDYYNDYSSSAQTNPAGSPTGPLRVYRGGSMDDDASECHTANRDNRRGPQGKYFNIRLVIGRPIE